MEARACLRDVSAAQCGRSTKAVVAASCRGPLSDGWPGTRRRHPSFVSLPVVHDGRVRNKQGRRWKVRVERVRPCNECIAPSFTYLLVKYELFANELHNFFLNYYFFLSVRSRLSSHGSMCRRVLFLFSFIYLNFLIFLRDLLFSLFSYRFSIAPVFRWKWCLWAWKKGYELYFNLIMFLLLLSSRVSALKNCHGIDFD